MQRELHLSKNLLPGRQANGFFFSGDFYLFLWKAAEALSHLRLPNISSQATFIERSPPPNRVQDYLLQHPQ